MVDTREPYPPVDLILRCEGDGKHAHTFRRGVGIPVEDQFACRTCGAPVIVRLSPAPAAPEPEAAPKRRKKRT